MEQNVPVRIDLKAWTSKPSPPPGYAARRSVNWHNANGYFERDKGFRRQRLLSDITSKAAASWVHRHTDGGEHIIYYCNTALYTETGSDLPSTLSSGITETWLPVFASMGTPLGAGLFVNGSQAPILIREASGSPETADANFPKPNSNWTATGATTGGSLAAGDYLVRIAQVEVHATTGTIVSGPAEYKTANVASGSTGKVTVAHSTWSPHARATHWRIGITALNGTDSPANYFWSGSDTLIATTSVDITSIPTSTTPFEYRNGIYATTDLTDLNASHPKGVVVHQGRFFVWWGGDNDIAWSERGLMKWYTTNSMDSAAQTGWTLPIKTLVSWRGTLVAFTPQSIVGIFGDFSRDLDGAAPSYGVMASSRPLVTGVGIMGGPYAAAEINGDLYFMSTQGPALFNGKVVPLAPEDIEYERRCWDTSTNYPNRWCVAEDPDLRLVCFSVTRKTNASRPMDGASVAGTPDYIYRWNPRIGAWSAPRQLDCAHLSCRPNGTAGSENEAARLMVMTPHGTCSQMNYGHAGGVSNGVVTSANYDGILASANTTTTATIAMSGISADDFKGHTVTLTYPSGDSTYPYVKVQKTISDNTATSGGNITITWTGAVTVPSTSFWTVRVSGYRDRIEFEGDVRDLLQLQADQYAGVERVEVRLRDVVGTEAVS